MEQKTQVHAENGKQDIVITRLFDLPVDLLFRAYTEAALLEEWMGTHVLKLENKPHGGWQFETRDAQGKPVFRAHGVIHNIVQDQQIVRTFEMDHANFAPQLEFLDFEALTTDTSKLTIHIIFRTVALRDQQLKLPFAQGLNMAHNKLQQYIQSLKKS